jgi:molybdopterin-guanine dinucleotide biosynthesis protein B
MVPTVSLVGKSGVGKTYVMTRMIAELKTRGYRVATLKHSHHSIDLDLEGKDSWQHAQAGSDVVAISAPHMFAVMAQVDRDIGLAEISRLIGPDFDIILAEGFKQDNAAKIEVHRREIGSDMVCEPNDLLAIVTDERLDIGVPQYAPDDAAGIVDLIEERCLRQSDGDMVSLHVDGKQVPLNDFVRRLFSNVLSGLISPLKGIGEADAIDIVIRKKAKR